MDNRAPSYWTVRRNIRCEYAAVVSDLELVENVDGGASGSGPNNHAVTHTTDRPVSYLVDSYDGAAELSLDFDELCDNPEMFCHGDDSDHDSGSEPECNQSDNGSDERELVPLAEKLTEWALKCDVPRTAVGDLLRVLKPYHPELPTDARTLVGTPRNVQEITALPGGGQYVHLGLKKGIESFLRSHLCVDAPSTLELQINVDGLPLFKSSGTALWPILCLVKWPLPSEPFVVGVYCGQTKPSDLNAYLSDFVNELLHLLQYGIDFGESHFGVTVNSFVCDAPARAMLKNIKGHSGFHGCEKCHDEGEWHNKVTFLSTASVLRTDEEFAHMSDSDHHLGPSVLSSLPVGLVSQFPLDYMHLVCLGVMRRLLLCWLRGPLLTRLPAAKVRIISDKLVSLCPYIPREFVRKPRSLNDVMRWKATEFRQFLLYTGPVVLRDILPESLYENFLLLCVGIMILITPRLCQIHCDYAAQLLTVCVENMKLLYGEGMIVYNVHGLIHLAGDARKFGTLDNFSAFPFENALKCIKKLVRKPSFPLQQLTNRLLEKQQFGKKAMHSPSDSDAVLFKKEHCFGPVPRDLVDVSVRQYEQLHYKGMFIAVSCGDNCVSLADGKPCLVRNIFAHNNQSLLVVEHFSDYHSFFDNPLPSVHLNVYKTSHPCGAYRTVSIAEIACKCVCMPLTNAGTFVIFPLLHSQL